MRVLTIGNMYPPHHQGGYELIWASSVEALRAAGHEVLVLTTDHREPGVGEADEPGVHRELRWYWRDHDFPRFSARERVRLERANAAVLEHHLADLRPDVVSWWAMGGMSLSMIERVRRAGIPANAVVCDAWLTYAPQVDAWTRGLAGRRALGSLAERITGVPASVDLAGLGPFLFLSRMLLEQGRETLPAIDGTFCHRGPDRETFSEVPPDPWRWRLLYVGRIDSRKGVATAVEALAELPAEATLQIVGSGDEQHLAELRARTEQLGLGDRVAFSVATREELAAVYADADAIVFPGAWPEPWGLVPLEAMAVGRPVVATGTGGSGEYLRDGENCLLFDPAGGPPALAQALTRLAGDPDLRDRLRSGGAATVERLDAREFNRAVAELCERAVSSSARG